MRYGEGDQLRKRVNEIQTHVYPDMISRQNRDSCVLWRKQKYSILNKKKSSNKFSGFYPVRCDRNKMMTWKINEQWNRVVDWTIRDSW